MTQSRLMRTAAALAPLMLPLAAPALAAEDVPVIVTDIPAVHSLAAAVMAGVGEPVLLLDRGASPHHFQLRPSQAAALNAADAVFWVGPALTPWLDRAVAGLPKAETAVRLDQVPGLFTQPYGATGPHDHGDHDHDAPAPAAADHTGHDHAAKAPAAAPAAADDHAGHDHGAETGGEHDGHDHSGTDPHLWLDPANARLWLGAIAEHLAKIDPDHAATYRDNAAKTEAQLAGLDAQIAETLAPLRGKSFAVFHDAYGYFTGHYGLMPAYPVALGDAALPGAERLAALRAEMQSGNIRCAFPEIQHDPKQIQQLVENTDVRLGGALDPSGSSLTPGAALYPALLTGLSATLVDCLTQP